MKNKNKIKTKKSQRKKTKKNTTLKEKELTRVVSNNDTFFLSCSSNKKYLFV